MQINFRKMTPEDASAVEVVEKSCFDMPWSRQSFWQEASNDKAYYLLALDGERVIGYVGVWILFDEAQITNVAITPEYQNKGVNALLFSDLIPIYQKLGFIFAESNPELEMNGKVQAQWEYFKTEQHKRRRAFVKKID